MPGVIRVRDNPGVWWLLALLFIGVGALFVYLGISQSAQIEWWQAPRVPLRRGETPVLPTAPAGFQALPAHAARPHS